MGELTGEDWFVNHWRRRGDPPGVASGGASGGVSDAAPGTAWAEHEAEQVWYFARCERDVLELASLEQRLYYGPVGAVEGFSQPSSDAPVQFNMELYGEHHSALFSLRDGRLNVLNQLPEHEPLDLFVRQLNESLDRTGRHLVEVGERAGTLRLVKSPATATPLDDGGRLRRPVLLVAALVGLVAAAGAVLWFLARGDDERAEPATTVAVWSERATLTVHPSADCRLGAPRRDESIEVREVRVADGAGPGGLDEVVVSFAGRPFDRYSTAVDLVVPDEPPVSVESSEALTYLFVAGRRWHFDVHSGAATAVAVERAGTGAVVPLTAPVVTIETTPDGRDAVRFAIADFPPASPGFEGGLIVATFGTAERGDAEPAACTANLLGT